jgi:hypothetical protein
MRGGLLDCFPIRREAMPIGMYRFYRGPATGAFTEAQVMDETGVMWVTASVVTAQGESAKKGI